jgi:hypothetical protein
MLRLVTVSSDMGSKFYSCPILSPVSVKTPLLFCQYICSLRNYAHAFRVAYSSLRSLYKREHFYFILYKLNFHFFLVVHNFYICELILSGHMSNRANCIKITRKKE